MLYLGCTKDKKIKFTVGDLYYGGVKVVQTGDVRPTVLSGTGTILKSKKDAFEITPDPAADEDQIFKVEVDVTTAGGLRTLTELITVRPYAPVTIKKLYLTFAAPSPKAIAMKAMAKPRSATKRGKK